MARKPYWNRHRRSVRWLAGIFLLSQITLAVVVDQFADDVRDPEYSQLESLLIERQAENPNKPLAVFVGSSRVVHGFDAEHAAGEEHVTLFNFGVPGSGPYFQSVMLDRLRKRGVKPDILFLELLHPFYNAAGPRAMDQGLLDGARLSAKEAAGLFEYSGRSRTGPLRRWAYARLLPAYRHQAEMRDRLGFGVYSIYGALTTVDAYGFRPKRICSEDRDELTHQARTSYDPFYGDFRLNNDAWKRLALMIGSAQKEGVAVSIVLMPEGSEFRQQYTLDGEHARCDMLNRLRKEFAVDVVDARDWLDDSAFYDQHHLLPEGAKQFAERFRTDGLKPMLARIGR